MHQTLSHQVSIHTRIAHFGPGKRGGGPTANVHEHASGLDLDAPVVWDGSPLALLDVGAGGLVEEIDYCLEWGVRANGGRRGGGKERGGLRGKECFCRDVIYLLGLRGGRIRCLRNSEQLDLRRGRVC